MLCPRGQFAGRGVGRAAPMACAETRSGEPLTIMVPCGFVARQYTCRPAAAAAAVPLPPPGAQVAVTLLAWASSARRSIASAMGAMAARGRLTRMEDGVRCAAAMLASAPRGVGRGGSEQGHACAQGARCAGRGGVRGVGAAHRFPMADALAHHDGARCRRVVIVWGTP